MQSFHIFTVQAVAVQAHADLPICLNSYPDGPPVWCEGKSVFMSLHTLASLLRMPAKVPAEKVTCHVDKYQLGEKFIVD